jgi:alkaline phosphatase
LFWHGAIVPGLKYNSKAHSNSLVPLVAKGAGSESLKAAVVGHDPIRGPYVDNTGVSQVLLKAVHAPK